MVLLGMFWSMVLISFFLFFSFFLFLVNRMQLATSRTSTVR